MFQIQNQDRLFIYKVNIRSAYSVLCIGLVSDLYSEEAFPAEIEIKLTQFIKLLDDWHSKVSEKRPKEVTINFNNDIFTIETSE